MSDITRCPRCGNKLDPKNYFIFSKFFGTVIHSKEIVCKSCFLADELKYYYENGIFSIFLLHEASKDDPIFRKLVGKEISRKLYAADSKINKKIDELESEILFNGSLLRLKLGCEYLELLDTISYVDPATHNFVVIQKQSKRIALWLYDTLGTSIEITVTDEDVLSMILDNITATFENAMSLLDWVIANHSIIATNLH